MPKEEQKELYNPPAKPEPVEDYDNDVELRKNVDDSRSHISESDLQSQSATGSKKSIGFFGIKNKQDM